MIGEAIDVLSEHGGSENSISAFIPAHNRLLRHYLDKHVAEGFFVCTAAGRYLRSSEENTVGECPVERAAGASSEEACVAPPVAEAKRGRGRPRKDGSSPAGKKDGARGQRPAMVGLTDDEGSVPTSPVAVAEKKDGSQAASSSTPKRRGRLRKLGMATATNSSGKALVACKKDDSEVPYTTEKEHEPPRELALVIIGDDSATTSIMDKACSEVPPITPGEGGGQPLELALVTTTDVSVLPAPTPATNKDSETINQALVTKNDSICTISTAPEPSSQACDLAPMVADDIPVPVLVADNYGVEEAPSATYNHVHQLRGSASTAAKKAGSKTLSGTTQWLSPAVQTGEGGISQ